MTETQFTGKFVRALREHLGLAFIVWKHADGYSAGIPDISISCSRDTMWIEAKLMSNPKIFEPLQLAILKKLEGHYVIWDAKIKRGCRFRAEDVVSREQVQDRCRYAFNKLVENILDEVR